MPVPDQTVPRRRKPRPRYWLRRLMVLSLLAVPFLIWWGWSFWKGLPLQAEGSAPRVASGPVYVAIMGVDERKDDVGRSDTLMLLRLDAKLNRVDIVNIPRDTLITFDSGKQSKINAAYSIGKADLTCDVLKSLLGIPKPYYVTLNFQAFIDIVDALDGVSLHVDKHYVYDDPYQDLHIDIPAGQQTLKGEQALHYVRLRYDGVTNSDIARIERQQQFLKALKDKLSSPAYWSRIPDLVAILRTNTRTNIPEKDQLKLAQAMYTVRGNVTMQTLPGTADDATGDWIINPTAWKGVTEEWAKPPATAN